jgi:predicted transcriptional regulator YdeE
MPSYHVQRSIDIDASPDKVFDVVSDYGTWTTWSPWLCADPEAQVEVSDDSASEGAVYAWHGELVGQGELEHKRLEPSRGIEDELRFMKPFKSVCQTSFDLEPAGDGTRLTWHMRGKLPWFMFWMKSQMEVFIGMDYERGLRMLKEWTETGQILSRTSIQGVQSIGPIQVIGVRRKCSTREIGTVLPQAMCEAQGLLQEHGLSTDTERISVYHHFDVKQQTFDFTSGHLMPTQVERVTDKLSSWSIPEVQALRVDHFGTYDHLGNGWSAANQYARYKKLKQSKVGAFELYKNDPQHTHPADILTEIYLPLR